MKKLIMILLLSVASLAGWAKQPETDDEIQAEKYEEYKEAFSRVDSSKLPDLIAKIEQRRSEKEQANALFKTNGGLIPIMGTVMPFVMVIFIIGFTQYFRYKRKRDQYQLITKYIELGREVPIELLKEPKQTSSDLRRGLVSLGFGLAIVIGGFMLNMKLVWIGLIPTFVGIAYILSHFLIKKKDEN